MKLRKTIQTTCMAVILAMSLVAMTGCGQAPTETSPKASPATQAPAQSGKITIDGSSTVFPITAAVAEEYKSKQPNVAITVAQSGTGGGMKKFVAGEIDIVNASRHMKQEEKDAAAKKGISFTEFTVAYDGISIVVNKDNTWAQNITSEELNKLWDEKSTVKTWKEVNPAWPDQAIKLYGPGTDSGTFEYFTEAINKKAKSSRKDYTPSEDDNVLVKGVSGDKNALGYFGFAYYLENKDKIHSVKVNGVAPDFDTIKNGSYSPLSRPLFVYVNNKAMEQIHVKAFMQYYLTDGTKLIQSVGYIPLDANKYQEEFKKIK